MVDLVKLILIMLVVVLVPLLFILIFDIAAHLSDLFGER